MKYRGAVKAGKLANGLEKGKGTIIHIIEAKYIGIWGYSLCGQKPAISWIEKDIKAVTCSKCIKQLEKEIVMSNLLGEINKMVKE